MATITTPTVEQLVNDWTGKVNNVGGITSGASTVTIVNATSDNGSGVVLPTGTTAPFRIRFTDGTNEEWCRATRSSTTLTLITRGENSTPRAWPQNTVIEAVPTMAGLSDWYDANIQGGYDYETMWDGISIATLRNCRQGGVIATAAEIGSLINKAGREHQLVGPTGTSNMPVVGCSILITNRGTDNTPPPVNSSDFVGKPLATSAASSGGTISNGGTVMTDSTFNFDNSHVGYLVYIDGAGGGKEYIGVSTAASGHTLTVSPAAGSAATNAGWTLGNPLEGVHLYAMSPGIRGVSGHPDRGGSILEASGATWGGDAANNAGAVIDFRNAVSWTGKSFGTHNFNMTGVSVDPNGKADFATCGYGYGLGGVCRFAWCNLQVGTVGGHGLGNFSDGGGNSDIEWIATNICNSPGPITKNFTGTNGQNLASLPSGQLTLANTTNIPKHGYGEINSSQGVQLISWSGTSGTTLNNVVGGVGTLQTTANATQSQFKFFTYGLCLNLGDQWDFGGSNIQTDGHAALINVNSAVRWELHGGHWSGGTGGPGIVVANGRHGVIDCRYIDNITTINFGASGGTEYAYGGIWIAPQGAPGAGDIVITPQTYFHLTDSTGTCVPVVLDGANTTTGSWGYVIQGQTTGATPNSQAFLLFRNGWTPGRGVVMKNIQGFNTNAIYATENSSTAQPDSVDFNSINLSTTGSNANLLIGGLSIPPSTTASLPAATLYPEGMVIYDTTVNRLKVTNGTNWLPFDDAYMVASNHTTAVTPGMGGGRGRIATFTQSGAAVTVNAPTTVAGPGAKLLIEFVATGSPSGVASFSFASSWLKGASGDLTYLTGALALNNKRSFEAFYNGTDWHLMYRSPADYT